MKKFLFGIVFCLVVAAGVAYYAWQQGWIGEQKELQIDKTENVVTSVKQIAELVSMRYYEEFTISTSKTNELADNATGKAISGAIDNLFGKGTSESVTKDELVVIAKGHVRAGFNLANMTEDDVKIKDGVLYLTLPKVEIIDATVNPSDFEVFIESGKWSHEQVQKLEDKAIAELKARAIKAGVLDKAKENGIAELTNMYKAFGFKNVVCTVEE